MKIAMIGHKRIPSREGGIEIVVGKLCEEMVKRGHSVTAYNRKSRHVAGKEFDNGKHQKEYNGVKLVWVPTPNSSKLNAIVYSAFATLRAVLKGYDVIHFHAEGPSAMVPLAKLFGKRCIVTIHGLDWQRAKWGGFATKFLKFGEKTAAKYADEVIVLSKNVQDYFKNTYGRETVFIPNGIEMPEIKGNSLIKERYSLEKDGYILFLGRIVPEKGLHYLIDAFMKTDTDKKLVIAGSTSHSDEYVEEVNKLAENDNRIIFTGFVQGQELEELYSNAYIYCLPSDLEGMPISLLEAMSYSNCCLTSDIAECTEVCGDSAVSFKAGDVDDLHKKLYFLLKNPQEVQKYKSTAADYVCSKYNWQDVTEQTLKLYEKTEG